MNRKQRIIAELQAEKEEGDSQYWNNAIDSCIAIVDRHLPDVPSEAEIERAAVEINPDMCGKGQNYSELAMKVAKSKARACLQAFMGDPEWLGFEESEKFINEILTRPDKAESEESGK